MIGLVVEKPCADPQQIARVLIREWKTGAQAGMDEDVIGCFPNPWQPGDPVDVAFRDRAQGIGVNTSISAMRIGIDAIGGEGFAPARRWVQIGDHGGVVRAVVTGFGEKPEQDFLVIAHQACPGQPGVLA